MQRSNKTAFNITSDLHFTHVKCKSIVIIIPYGSNAIYHNHIALMPWKVNTEKAGVYGLSNLCVWVDIDLKSIVYVYIEQIQLYLQA